MAELKTRLNEGDVQAFLSSVENEQNGKTLHWQILPVCQKNSRI